jgi:hypothetical protein
MRVGPQPHARYALRATAFGLSARAAGGLMTCVGPHPHARYALRATSFGLSARARAAS